VTDHSWEADCAAFALAIRWREAKVQIGSVGGGSAAPSFVAISASSLPGMLK
jgi:hypothetical protein